MPMRSAIPAPRDPPPLQQSCLRVSRAQIGSSLQVRTRRVSVWSNAWVANRNRLAVFRMVESGADREGSEKVSGVGLAARPARCGFAGETVGPRRDSPKVARTTPRAIRERCSKAAAFNAETTVAPSPRPTLRSPAVSRPYLPSCRGSRRPDARRTTSSSGITTSQSSPLRGARAAPRMLLMASST